MQSNYSGAPAHGGRQGQRADDEDEFDAVMKSGKGSNKLDKAFGKGAAGTKADAAKRANEAAAERQR